LIGKPSPSPLWGEDNQFISSPFWGGDIGEGSTGPTGLRNPMEASDSFGADSDKEG